MNSEFVDMDDDLSPENCLSQPGPRVEVQSIQAVPCGDVSVTVDQSNFFLLFMRLNDFCILDFAIDMMKAAVSSQLGPMFDEMKKMRKEVCGCYV